MNNLIYYNMKNLKKIILTVLIGLPILLNAQKLKIEYDDKTNNVSVNGEISFKIERFDCGFGMVDCHFDVHDLDGNKVIRINYRQFNSPVERKAANPDGIVRYYEFIFLDSKQKAEIKYVGISSKKLANSIVTNKLIENGKLDKKAVDEFILINGTPFSERIKF